MTHSDRGHYSKKHKDVQINDNISKKLKEKTENNKISCASVHKVAADLNISPSQAGIQADLNEFRLYKCQLGLFGWDPEGKNFDPDFEISSQLDEQLDSFSTDGRLSCIDCWDIAKKLKLKKLDIGSACEKKGFRIKPCQLGAF